MKIKIDTSGMLESRWYEYVIRFAFGGTATALAGIIAKHYGPAIGGLFLAFPAIFPASATLLEKHQREKLEDAGKNGAERGRGAAAVDAAGAAMGSFGLVVFGFVVWLGLPKSNSAVVLAGGTVAWFLTAILIWECREKLWRRLAFRWRVAHSSGIRNVKL
ncbi:MAG: DUF3147 family protein [Candidatus Sulfotelmatobacter sp.]